MLHWRAVLFGWLALAASTSAAAAQDGPDSLLTQFYQRRGYRLAWIDSGGVSSQARRLLEMLARADREGLDPNDYDVATSDSSAWRLDSTLTRAFLFYGWDVSRGRVSPALVDSLWTAGDLSAHAAQAFGAARHFATVAALIATLAEAPPIASVVVKGSRFMRMEQVVAALTAGGAHAA